MSIHLTRMHALIYTCTHLCTHHYTPQTPAHTCAHTHTPTHLQIHLCVPHTFVSICTDLHSHPYLCYPQTPAHSLVYTPACRPPHSHTHPTRPPEAAQPRPSHRALQLPPSWAWAGHSHSLCSALCFRLKSQVASAQNSPQLIPLRTRPCPSWETAWHLAHGVGVRMCPTG